MKDSSDKFLYFLVGASIGSVFALLFAPKSGQETRDEITRRAQESRDYVNRKVEKSRGYVEESASRVSNEVTSLVDRGKQEASELIDQGKDVVHQQKEQFVAAFEAGREAYLHGEDTD